jgi:hypothetical protein
MNLSSRLIARAGGVAGGGAGGVRRAGSSRTISACSRTSRAAAWRVRDHHVAGGGEHVGDVEPACAPQHGRDALLAQQRLHELASAWFIACTTRTRSPSV